jgi:hypothetical protein
MQKVINWGPEENEETRLFPTVCRPERKEKKKKALGLGECGIVSVVDGQDTPVTGLCSSRAAGRDVIGN